MRRGTGQRSGREVRDIFRYSQSFNILGRPARCCLRDPTERGGEESETKALRGGHVVAPAEAQVIRSNSLMAAKVGLGSRAQARAHELYTASKEKEGVERKGKGKNMDIRSRRRAVRIVHVRRGRICETIPS